MRSHIKWIYYCYFCEKNTLDIIRLKEEKSIPVCSTCQDEGKHLNVEFNENVLRRKKKNY